MKPLLVLGVFSACCIAGAQIPELQVHLDVTGSLRAETHQPNLFQFYDVMGRPSTLSLAFYTPQGFRVYAAEKLQPLPGDAVGDPFDEYYFEDEGIWRVGKQYLPFGSGKILHESALAARGDTSLILENVPVAFAFCNGGDRLQSGAIGRIGSMVGFSAAVGRHFGIAATSLDDVRLPEDAPGEGRGWKQAFAIDGSHRFHRWTIRAEAVNFQQGETPLDTNLTIFETAASLEIAKGVTATLTATREMPNRVDFYRLSGTILLVKRITFEPMIRFKDGSLFDLVAQVRVRF